MTLPIANGSAVQRWCVAQVKPRQEQIAITHLLRQNFAVRCPRVKRAKRVRGRTIIMQEPFFPGYVFVGLDEAGHGWRSINGTIGVIRVVAFGQQPSMLPKGFVEQLGGQAEGSDHLRFREDLKDGDAVRIVGGIFDDLCGALTGAATKDRVTVLLRLLSGETRVTLPRAALVSA